MIFLRIPFFETLYDLSLNFKTCRFAYWRCIEEEVMSLSVFTIVFALFSVTVAVSTYLLCLLSPLLSYVAVTSRPRPLSAQPINLVNRKVLHKTRAWHLRNFTDLQTFKEEPREHDNAINHFRDHTLYNIPRRRNIGQRDISCMAQVFDSGSSRCGRVWYYRFNGRKIEKNQYSVLKLRYKKMGPKWKLAKVS